MIQLNLVGDSHVLRFQRYLKANPHVKVPFELREIIAVSGATAHDLKSQIKTSRPAMESKLPLLIFVGTNDITKHTPIKRLKNEFLSLLRLIKRLYAPSTILILALPPFLRYLNSPKVLGQIDDFNKWLATLQSTHTCVITLPIYQQNARHYFLPFYYNSSRPDRIHLNHHAYQLLIKEVGKVLHSIQ
jgi:lysophospholipase L1-like esterase